MKRKETLFGMCRSKELVLRLLLVIQVIVLVAGQQQAAFVGPPGWRMVDRFYGFRFELRGDNLHDSEFSNVVEKKANEMGCFGWIQQSPRGTLVGEMRCNINRGPLMETFLKEGHEAAKVTDVDTKVYKDTKIRLHFSSFKVLPDDRETCFLEPPHQCEDVAARSSETDGGEL